MTIPYITPKQQQIPKQINRFRFLDRKQIQKIMGHKDKRRINSWLKDLVTKEYLEKIDDSSSEQRKMAVYRIGINGIRFLKTQDNIDNKLLHKLYREKDRSGEFIAHSLFLADIFLNLAVDTTEKDLLTFSPQSEHFSTDCANTLTKLSPDAYITRRKGKGKTKRFLLHDIPESMLRFRSFKLRKKIRDYIAFFLTDEWENETKTSFPILLFILPDMAALIYLQRYIQKILNDNDHPKIDIWLSTKERIKKQGFTATPWEEVE
jgi:hypothetical protein